MTEEVKETKKKRGPGRPSKKPPSPVIEIKGISNKPVDKSNRLEAVCQTPGAFKNLFTYFKNNGSGHIFIRCSKTGLSFFARDANRKTRIMARADGKNLAWYYFSDEKDFFCSIKLDNVTKVFSSINKSFNKMQLELRHDTLDKIMIILKDPDIDKECSYEIALSNEVIEEDLKEVEKILVEEELKKFPIDFTLTAKQLKKTVTDPSGQSDTITLEKIGTKPLQLSYQSGQTQYYEVYRDDKKINLRSEVKPDETFSLTINLPNIKAVANSMITDLVKIFCRENGDIVFRSAIDDKALILNAVIKNTD